MPGQIHLVRHAEGLHNLRQDVNIRDAPLSKRGCDNADALGRDFIAAHSDRVGAVISSPFRRSIQTSLIAFRRILDAGQYPANMGVDAKPGVWLALDPALQELGDLPCNTGSPVNELKFKYPALSQLQRLDPNWYIKPQRNLPPAPQRQQEILRPLERAQADEGRREKPGLLVLIVCLTYLILLCTKLYTDRAECVILCIILPVIYPYPVGTVRRFVSRQSNEIWP